MEIYFKHSYACSCIMPSTLIEIQCLSLLTWFWLYLRKVALSKGERLEDLKTKSVLVSIHDGVCLQLFQAWRLESTHDRFFSYLWRMYDQLPVWASLLLSAEISREQLSLVQVVRYLLLTKSSFHITPDCFKCRSLILVQLSDGA